MIAAYSHVKVTVMENVKRLLPNPDNQKQLIGTLVGVDGENRPLVDFESNSSNKPIPALSLINFPSSTKAWFHFPIPALINLVGNNNQPIIVGLIHEQLFSHPGQEIQTDNTNIEMPIEEYTQHKLNADFINIEGNDEIQFNCGKSSLSLKKNGQIIIKGEDITNRARSNNKIRGGSVKIN